MTHRKAFSIAIVAFSVLGLGAAGLRAGDDKPTPCTRTEFKTTLVKEACTAGGSKAAQDAMRDFSKKVKEAKKAAGEEIQLNCNFCHSDIKKTSGYPLKPDGLKHFEELQAFLDSQTKK